MSILKHIFNISEPPVTSEVEFWDWFQRNERGFYKAISTNQDVEDDFLQKLAPKLNELREGYYFLAGMMNNDTAELIITADGLAKNIPFVERLIAGAPPIDGWKFTALKPALPISDVAIGIGEYKFSADNLSFHPNIDAAYPDEIDITVVCSSYNEQDKMLISNGIFIFLENYLGELNLATSVDNITMAATGDERYDLVPIGKLADYLVWRQKEFVEKYEADEYNADNDGHTVFEAELPDGQPLLAVINTTLLEWDRKASHPWILAIEIKPGNEEAQQLMPDEATHNTLDALEDDITAQLNHTCSCLNIGRETTANQRKIYYACRDFRQPSLATTTIAHKYAGTFDISYEMYKDKYWRSFERFLA